ncbi:MAG TPA: nucleotidyl transferase AbiEii/AbiGii toxin family protein [Thermoplasmata archaeon]|nr:nucleotidyl transferase AbiEii/AbiGii toxin family protein [Thermoplasmata archaeon]
MATIDPADLADALAEGFPQATVEKVQRLLGILRELQTDRSTKGRFTLKGGTALNVFHSSKLPRLSVDLDLMTTGFVGAAAGTAAHERVVVLVERVVRRLGYASSRTESPAACTIDCRYRNLFGGVDHLKIDLDLLNRQTLLPARSLRGPRLFLADDVRFPVVREAELLGQKLVAVAYRAHPRDLYDMHAMLQSGWHARARARHMYLAYSFLSDHEWYRLAYPVRLRVDYQPRLLEDVLRDRDPAPTLAEIRAVARAALERADPPFTIATLREQSLRRNLLKGERNAFADIAGETVATRRRKLARHPGLAWRLRQAARPAAHR